MKTKAPKIILNVYSATRNELIPLAECEANRRSGKRPDKGDEFALEEWTDRWNKIFHRAMNQLWREFKNSGKTLHIFMTMRGVS